MDKFFLQSGTACWFQPAKLRSWHPFINTANWSELQIISAHWNNTRFSVSFDINSFMFIGKPQGKSGSNAFWTVSQQNLNKSFKELIKTSKSSDSRSPSKIGIALMNCPSVRDQIVEKVMKVVSMEVTSLCYKTNNLLLGEVWDSTAKCFEAYESTVSLWSHGDSLHGKTKFLLKRSCFNRVGR